MQVSYATESIAVQQAAAAAEAFAESFETPQLIDAHLLEQVCGAGKLADAPGNGW